MQSGLRNGTVSSMDWKLRISGTIGDSIVDGPGLRYVIFTQGCPHHCKGCQNPQTHDLEGGYLADWETILAPLRENPLVFGVTFSGGEPFVQPEPLARLGREVKRLGKHLMIYTGYTYETDLLDKNGKARCEATDEFLSFIDILVDGEFDQDLYDISLKFCGSSNQRLLQIQKEGSPELVI